MPHGTQGTLLPSAWSSVMPKTMYAFMQAWYVERAPLLAFLPALPCANVKFDLVGHFYRPRSSLLTTTINTSVTELVVADASIFQAGDSVQVNSVEVCEVTAVTIGTNTLTVRRAAAGTTATAVTASGTTDVYNLGNTATGGEKNRSAIVATPVAATQYIQNFQHQVAVSGVMEAVGRNLPLPAETPTPMSKAKMEAMQNLVDDIEVSSLYGYGEEATGSVTRAKQKGIYNLLSTNHVSSPTNASAYKPSDFETDILEKIRDNGGRPGLIMVSSKFRSGMRKWGDPLQAWSAGQTAYGTDIRYFTSPLLGDTPIVENMWLNRLGRAALVLDTSQVNFRVLEDLKYVPYGMAGDLTEGHWVHRCAIALDNEKQHGLVRNITGFAQET